MKLAVAGGLAGVLLLAWTLTSRSEPGLLILGAASVEEVLLEVGAEFEARAEVAPVFSFAGSGVLARQLVAGVRGDVFVSADREWIDELGERVRTADEVTFGNRLVVIGRGKELASPIELLEARELILADPDSAPAGRYARRALMAIPAGASTLWEQLESRLIPASDVRAALNLVAARPGAVAVVYETDARLVAGSDLDILHRFDTSEAPIEYVAVAVAGSSRLEAATDFLALLGSTRGEEILLRHGFLAEPE